MTAERYTEEDLREACQLTDEALTFFREVNNTQKAIKRAVRIGSLILLPLVSIIGLVGTVESAVTDHEKIAANCAITCGGYDVLVLGLRITSDLSHRGIEDTGALLTRVALERKEIEIGVGDLSVLPEPPEQFKLDI
jgi:hypothetical protein